MTHLLRKILTVIMATSLLSSAPAAVSAAERASWTVLLRPTDFVVGDALGQLNTRRQWITGFDERSGVFEIALRRKAIAISAPRCRMDYLILTIPVYYPENPKQASVRERRVVYDALVALQAKGKGSATVGVEAPEPLSRLGKRGIELVACNLYFAFPISVQVSTQ